jgi:hypothetical protein
VADDNFDDGDDLDYYHDDPDQEINDKPDRKKNIVIGFCASVVLIISAIFYLPSSIGGKIVINTGANTQLGTAVLATVACSSSTSLLLTPSVTFSNSVGGGSFPFKSYKVENIPSSCRGADITLSVYNNTSSAPLSLFDSSTTSSSIATVYMNNTDTFTAVNSPNFKVTTNSASSFTVSFDQPAALGTDGAKMTLMSTKHDDSIGKNFISRTSGNSNYWFDLEFGKGVFVAASRAGQVMSSPDGITWTTRTSKVAASEGIAFGKGYFILFPMADRTTTNGQYSADGANWTAINTGTCSSCVSGVFGGDYFFGVSDGEKSIYSTTGLSWTSAAVSFAKIPRDVCYGDNKFIVTSQNQSGGNFQSSASPLGPWVLGTLISTTGNTSWVHKDYIMCAYGGGRYVAVKNDYAWVSANGNSWTQQQRIEGSWSSVAYGNGIFVAISDNNSKVMTSEDGTNWSISDHGLAGTWRKVIFAKGMFVMVGDSGKVATSG